MSPTLTITPLARRLAGTLRPAEVYAALTDWLEECGSNRIRGLYLAGSDERFHLDAEAPHDPDAPRWMTETESAESVSFGFRNRPLGSIVFAEPVTDPALREAIREDFAPALFRALYLSDAASELAHLREQIHYLDGMGKFLGELDLEQLLVNILELTTSHLGADLGSVTLLRDAEVETAVDWGLPHDALLGLRLREGTPVLEHAWAERRPLLLGAEDLEHAEDEAYRFEHLVILPLATKDAVWGSINLVFPDRAAGLDAEALESIRSGVALAATAVENALLLEIKLAREREQEQLKLGQQIQNALLPEHSPEFPGVDVAGSSVAATMIGGDYFDYFELPDGRLGLVVADVAGKGVPAGLIMTATRAMFRAAVTKISDPASVLGEVNHLLCSEHFGSRFVTAIFAAVDPQSGRVEYATAGHDAPVVVDRDGNPIDVPTLPALPMGLRATFRYENQSFSAQPGSRFVLFTDGVSEAMNAEREQFGIERIRQNLSLSTARTAREFRDALVEQIDDHCGDLPRHDDTTLIVVVRREPAEEGPGHDH